MANAKKPAPESTEPEAVDVAVTDKVPSMKLAWAGLLIIGAVALWWTGRLIAMFMWDTIYYPRYFLIQDLGARTCATVADGAAPRMVCSDGHVWYSLGAISGGVVLSLAGVLLMLLYAQLQRSNFSKSLDPRNALVLGVGAIVVGLCLIVQGSVDTLTNEQLVNTCYTVALAVLWVQALFVGIASLRYQPLFNTTLPVFNKKAAIISLVLVAVSIGGFLFYVASPPYSEFGLYQRVSLVPMSLWGLMLAAALTSPRFATDDPAYQEEPAANTQDAAWQFSDEPMESQDNPGAK